MIAKTSSKHSVQAPPEIASQPEGAGAELPSQTAPRVNTDERHGRIAALAYQKAAERGFAPGGELEDWLAAERAVQAEGL
jgi:hypothetical protein